ncbi:EF-hand domain-containing protein [Flagellimonas myxillae]|uniref:EF-hand domain-containing protein n=1 Tax=Flagellimonas myxillae TaxID=2942214 RepID=UPI00201F8D94|nr:EF-hand domain-containing protein [Muricauda myxillae]MCL6268242.1 EF-hand domain-containing protein [Muricauda myxillae]
MKKITLKSAIAIACFTLLGLTQLSAQKQGENGERRKPPTFEKLLEHMDANEDGKLSEDEIKGPLKEHFAKVDLNEDGYIDEEEFNKAPRPKKRGKNQ